MPIAVLGATEPDRIPLRAVPAAMGPPAFAPGSQACRFTR
jgi:hypothetical protein